MIIDWSNIFNTSHKLHGHIMIAMDAAKASGYPYYSWNGNIYEVAGSKKVGSYDEARVIKIDP